ncbi:MAG: ATP-dependent DNA helicase [Methanospirillum sp.]
MLTGEQERAINFGDGKLLILGCPGSGKTETITRRIARLIADGVPADSIVVFTFNNRATGTMISRLNDLLKVPDSKDSKIAGLYVNSMDYYCQQRLAQATLSPPFDMLYDLQRSLFCRKHWLDLNLEALWKSYPGRAGERAQYKVIRDFCASADLVRIERINPSDLQDPFRECYLRYLDCLLQENYQDPLGAITHYIEVLEEDAVLLAAEQKRVRHVFVDNYEDFNRLQDRVIRLLVGDHGNLCVAGDDDQCIYHFSGSDYQNIRSFGLQYRNVTPVMIRENFTSTPGIVSAAAQVIGNNSGRTQKVVKPWPEGIGRTQKGDIAACSFADEEAEADAIVQQIQLLQGLPYMNNRGEQSVLRYNDMAVLMRSVKGNALPLLTALDRARIPVAYQGGDFLTRPEVTVVMQALAYLGDYPFPNDEDPRPDYDSLSPTLDQIEEYYAGLGWKAADRPGFSPAMAALREEVDGASDLSIQTIYHRILQAMGADTAPFPEPSWYYNLGQLSQYISAFERFYPRMTQLMMRHFGEYVRDQLRYAARERSPDRHALPNAVTLSTIHGAKGSHFPVVFMPQLNEEEFSPDWTKRKKWFVSPRLFDRDRYAGDTQDDRRLFYVGITRSEKYLYLSSNRRGMGSEEPAAEPSIFFDEFPRDGVDDAFPVKPAANPVSPAEVAPRMFTTPFLETSWSNLSSYRRCPFGYRLQHVYGFRSSRRPVMEAGSAVHSVLETVHKQIRDGGFDDSLIPALVDESLASLFASQEGIDMEMAKMFVEQKTRDYVQRNQAALQWIAGIELPFWMLIGQGLVRGRMDLLLRDGDGGIEIRDIKKTEEWAIKSREETDRQLQIYALAAATLGLEVRQASIYAFDTGRILGVPIGPGALAAARSEVERMIEGVRKPEFPPTSDAGMCLRCDWGRICCEKPQG